MAYISNKAESFTLLEITFILLIIALLASLSLPKIQLNREQLCQQKIKHTIQLIHSRLSQTQAHYFLLQQSNKPSLNKLATNLTFNQHNCQLQLKSHFLSLNIQQKRGEIQLQHNKEGYFLQCTGQACSLIGI